MRQNKPNTRKGKDIHIMIRIRGLRDCLKRWDQSRFLIEVTADPGPKGLENLNLSDEGCGKEVDEESLDVM